MNQSDLRIHRLEPFHDSQHFDSGNEELNIWLQQHALAAQQMDSARTFVLTRSDKIVAYVSLAMNSAKRAEAPAKLVRGMPNYPVGIVLIARLAVDRTEQGAGLGSRLLAEALRMAVTAGEIAAARFVVVDAIDDRAAKFYRRHGFISELTEMRPYRRIKDIRASLDKSFDI